MTTAPTGILSCQISTCLGLSFLVHFTFLLGQEYDRILWHSRLDLFYNIYSLHKWQKLHVGAIPGTQCQKFAVALAMCSTLHGTKLHGNITVHTSLQRARTVINAWIYTNLYTSKMLEIAELIKLMKKERETQEKQMQDLIMRLAATPATPVSAVLIVSIPCFRLFDSTSELRKDYWARFNMFVGIRNCIHAMRGFHKTFVCWFSLILLGYNGLL